MSYTAQHLLKLFQLRYPSAFKAEIIKRDLDREDEGVESSGDEDGETDGWSSGDDDGEGGEDDEGEGESRQRPGGVAGGRGRESNLLSGLRAGKGSSRPFVPSSICGWMYVCERERERERKQ